jgi:hypothetical protein
MARPGLQGYLQLSNTWYTEQENKGGKRRERYWTVSYDPVSMSNNVLLLVVVSLLYIQ